MLEHSNIWQVGKGNIYMDIPLSPEIKQRKQRRHRLVLMAVFTTLTVIAILAVSLGAKTPALVRKDLMIETVHRGEFVREVRGPGKLVPSQSRWVVARTDATVEHIPVRPGVSVKVDTPIFELSNPDVQERLSAAEAAYFAAKADHSALSTQIGANMLALESSLAEIRGRFSEAQIEDEASRLGYEKGVVAAVTYKRASIEREQLKERMRIEAQRVAQSKLNMRAQVAASQARLDQLARARDLRRTEADALHVRAGIDGVVQQINAEEGQRVAAGTNLARIARPGTLMAELRIAESQASDLSPGQPATVEIGRSPVKGKVRRINPVVEKGTILVEVELLGTLPEGARSEQSVDGVILTERLPDTLFLARPINSMPESDGAVFRLSGPNKAKRTPVRFGKDSSSQIQVLRGLEAGDQIIVSDMSGYDKAVEISIE
ncbi:efflux RND transporter periplasmic adaptor subunit [[Pseudomonas] boreopolis]|uniref:efflux RND transporter periplasmic adaptor subunit n=1 Tax=Xanthomonas boreopolis TaxID=86183 RepID=UPI003D9BB687